MVLMSSYGRLRQLVEHLHAFAYTKTRGVGGRPTCIAFPHSKVRSIHKQDSALDCICFSNNRPPLCSLHRPRAAVQDAYSSGTAPFSCKYKVHKMSTGSYRTPKAGEGRWGHSVTELQYLSMVIAKATCNVEYIYLAKWKINSLLFMYALPSNTSKHPVNSHNCSAFVDVCHAEAAKMAADLI